MPTQCTVDDAGNVKEGDALCLVGWDTTPNPHRPKVGRATRARLATSKTVYGIAKTGADDDHPVEVFVAGDVVSTEVATDLGAGNSRIIATDITAENADPAIAAALQCRLKRIDRPDGSEHVCGTVDENGNLALQPRASRETSALVTYNPKGYGCPWDGIHDDAPGWADMMAAIPTGQAARIDVPLGMGYFSTAPHVTRYVHICGRGGGAVNPTSGWRTAPGECGLICDGTSTSTDGGSCQYSTIEHIDLASTLLLNTGPGGPHAGGEFYTFENQTVAGAPAFYERGNCVVAEANANPGRFFRVTSAGGMSAGGDPAGFAAAVNGETFVDDDLTWTCEAFPQSYVVGTVTSVGDRVFGWFGDNRYQFECTAVSGATTKNGAVWTTNTPFPLNGFTQPTVYNGYTYQAIQISGTGTTAPRQPTWPTTIGEEIVDNPGLNQITWRCLAGPIVIEAPLWTTDTTFAQNAFVQPSVFNGYVYQATAIAGSGTTDPVTPPVWPPTVGFSVLDNPGANQITWTCREAGVGAFGAPVFPWPGNPHPIVEANVTWTLKIHAGVWMKGAVTFRHSCVEGFMGPMAYIHGDGAVQGNDTSFARVDHINTTHCGEGACFRGSDCNGGTSGKISATNLGWKRPYSWTNLGVGPWDRGVVDTGYPCEFGGATIWDASLGGNTHNEHYSQDGGNAYVSADTPRAVFNCCRTENGSSDLIGGVSIWYGASSSFSFPPLGGGTIIDPFFGRGLRESMPSGGNAFRVGLSSDAGATLRVAFPMWTDDDSGFTGYWYESISINPIGTGWATMGRGPYSVITPRPIFGVSLRAARNTGIGAGPGVGLYRIYDGFFGGRDIADAPYTGYGCVTEFDPMLTSHTLRYGVRVVGDSFVIPQLNAAPGTWTRAICTASGLRAPRWLPNYGYTPENDGLPYDYEADQVEPTAQPEVMSDGTGTVWRFISGGGSGAVEPTWPVIAVDDPFEDADGNVWQYKGLTAVFEPAGFVDDRLSSLTPQRDQVWGDTSGTDPGATAAPARTKSWRRSANTTTASPGQVLFVIPIDDHTTNEIDVVISGKSTGSIDACTGKLSGSFSREGLATTERLGGDDEPAPKTNAGLAGTLFSLNINVDSVEVLVSPGAALDVSWNVTAQNVEETYA